MRFVPMTEQAIWHAKALDAAESATSDPLSNC
jgi:hypothetical protein